MSRSRHIPKQLLTSTGLSSEANIYAKLCHLWYCIKLRWVLAYLLLDIGVKAGMLRGICPFLLNSRQCQHTFCSDNSASMADSVLDHCVSQRLLGISDYAFERNFGSAWF